MSGDVLYSDVKFVKKGKGPGSSKQEDVTYSEVRNATPKPTKVNSPQDDDATYSMVTIAPAQRKAGEKEEETTYSEVQTGSQPNSPPGKSNTKKRVAIGLLIFLLVLAVILIVVGLLIKERTKEPHTASNLTATPKTATPITSTTITSTTTRKTTTSGTTCPLKHYCDTGWELNGTKCYNFSTTKSPWNQSRGTCKALGGALVKIDSTEEQRFLFYKVRELMRETDSEDKFWIGLTDAAREGEWRWVDDTKLNQSLSFWFENGIKKEPDNWTNNNQKPKGEDCVRMGEQGEGYVEKCWFDKDCEAEQRFICEKSPGCQNN